MAYLPQPIAKIRNAVRDFILTRKAAGDFDDADTLLVACSGGADSVAMASQVAFLAPRMGFRGGMVTVDHAMQPGSATQAQRVVGLGQKLGLDPVEVYTADGAPGGGKGPEGDAREIRYELLTRAVADLGARAVLLAHTMEDQAETVLLGLAYGSGTKALAGMPHVREMFWRPLLGVRRADTVKTCQLLDLPVWQDPTNDPQGPWRTAAGEALPRAALRHRVLPQLAEALGQNPVPNLARTAWLTRADAQYLDAQAEEHFRVIYQPERGECPGAMVGVVVEDVQGLPDAMRWRVLREMILRSGAHPTQVTMDHVGGVDRLITDWRGQKSVSLPGGRRGLRSYGRLYIV